MKRPSFQFYPADWQANSNLRRCSHEERGIWLDVLCLLHDQEEYGVVRWPLKEIAQAIGCTPAKLLGLVSKGVLKGADKGANAEALIYIPRHSRKDGEPVTLLPAQTGPVWYSSRMVVDEHKRIVRGDSGHAPKDAPKPPIGDASKDTPDTAPLRAGASSSSSSTNNSPIGELRGGKSKFVKPTLSELITEFNGRVPDALMQANKFLNHYESNGWKVGRNPMKSWPHAVANWISNCSPAAPREARETLIEKASDRSWAEA